MGRDCRVTNSQTSSASEALALRMHLVLLSALFCVAFCLVFPLPAQWRQWQPERVR